MGPSTRCNVVLLSVAGITSHPLIKDLNLVACISSTFTSCIENCTFGNYLFMYENSILMERPIGFFYMEGRTNLFLKFFHGYVNK